MTRLRILLTVTLSLGAWQHCGTPLHASGPIADIDIVLEQNPGGIIGILNTLGGADEILLALPADWIAAPAAVEVPAGWTMELGTGKKWIFVHLRSCAAEADGQGVEHQPSVAEQQQQQKQAVTGSFLHAQRQTPSVGLKQLMQRRAGDLVQYASCAADRSESTSSLRMKLTFGRSLDGTDKGIAIEAYRRGARMRETSGFVPPLLDPVAAADSLSGLVELPPTISPGETVRARILDTHRLPAGGRWSLGGAWLEEEPPAGAPPTRGTVTVSPVLGPRHDPARNAVRNVRRMMIAKGSAGSPAPEPAETSAVTFDVFELETPLALRDRGLALYAVAAAKERCTGPSAPQDTLLAEATSGARRATSTVLSCDATEPPPSLPNGVAVLALGAVGSQLTDALRDDIPYLLAVRAHESDAGWALVSYERSLSENALRATRTWNTLELTIPHWLPTDRPLSLSYEDRWGRQLLSVPELDDVEMTVPLADSQEPRITGGSRFSFAGGTACVCGAFPTEASRSGILIGSVEAETAAASSRSLGVVIPQGTPVGEVILSGNQEAGFTASDWHSVTILDIESDLDREQLPRGGSITLRMQVVGTDQPIPLKLTNRSPKIVRLEGSNEQTVTSSGGRENIVECTAQALEGGAFDIAWALDLPCACAAE